MNSDFTNLCKDIRRDIVQMFIHFDGGHLGSALSLVEILATLYFQEMKHVKVSNHPERDRFILSKGHGCLALYAVLGRLGYFSKGEWTRIGQPGALLGGHPTSGSIPGIEISTGSLGLGPSVAVGIAAAARWKGMDHRTFCILGDGECNEGSVWEAAMSAAHKKLSRLFFVIDCNGYQAYGKTSDVTDMGNLSEKWKAFGFETLEVDLTRNALALHQAFREPRITSDKPKAIICRTHKGMGLHEVENNPKWHNKTKLTVAEKQMLLQSVNA